MSNILKNTAFRLFFIADIISSFGVGMGTVGANWYVLAQTGSNKYVGFLLTLNVIVGFFITPLVGFVIDRFSRKWVIFYTFVFRIIGLGIVTVLFYMYDFHLYLIYSYTIINGIGWTTYLSASKSFIQEILTKDKLTSGNSFVEISMQVGMFTAGAASGILYKFWGFHVILLLNILTFAFSAILILFIKIKTKVNQKELQQERFWTSLKSGLRYLKTRPAIFYLGIVTIIPLVVTMLYNIVLPAYVTDIIKADSIVFGLSDMFYGIGGLLAGLAIVFISQKISNKKLVVSLFIFATLNLFLLSVNSFAIALYAGSLLLGVTNSSLRILMNTFLMEKVDPQYMGRSMAVWTGISLLLQMLGSSSIGFLLDQTGPRIGFVMMSLLMFIGLFAFTQINKQKNLGGKKS